MILTQIGTHVIAGKTGQSTDTQGFVDMRLPRSLRLPRNDGGGGCCLFMLALTDILSSRRRRDATDTADKMPALHKTRPVFGRLLRRAIDLYSCLKYAQTITKMSKSIIA